MTNSRSYNYNEIQRICFAIEQRIFINVVFNDVCHFH